MRVRHLIAAPKLQISETAGWSTSDLPPKHAPVNAKTRPSRAGWRWRSLRARGDDGREYVMFALANPSRDNWKAALTVEVSGSGHSIVAKFEFHASHPGLHVHADCGRSGIETGSTSLDRLPRTPKTGNMHRRINAWTEASFWKSAKAFFRIYEMQGTLEV